MAYSGILRQGNDGKSEGPAPQPIIAKESLPAATTNSSAPVSTSLSRSLSVVGFRPVVTCAVLQEEMDCATAEGEGPFQDHPRTQPDVRLELIPNLTQPQINCERLRRSTALLNKATSDLAMTIKYWQDLGDNSDKDLDKTMERKNK
ncbi:hypothetical protein CEXT_646891 [Caerostris extrusa]|uniref:Uncharacterized protein n=1 Tax=Caerostris extrusa TaxID=172846 RepID=A0AAV4UW24_CAEEX|nr:hypothetical protein CEXT_646891 [Caerostris extrusa]